MIKVKIIENHSIISLEDDINKWLSRQQNDTNSLLHFVLVDIKITPKMNIDNTPYVVAVIIYKKQ